ncbi:trinucleotide repeat-containing gene 6A protein [Drosophila kikkawai]|uniref:Trinucleotide repeat-containing gene 6A protein n=1 Tax=Drosophila kikkawai TaxID=30033 RepID=A0A6P4JA66_DROKI|nr:trinucleotide repeat-containing gene 6A protein-like [Drosophila kikkawai]
MNNVNINVQCECYHRRGLFYYANPLAWGRPCRRCRRMMARGIVVVPQVATPVQTSTTTVMPAQCATNWQMQQQQMQQPMNQQMQQQPMPMPMQMQQPQVMSALPPKYDQVVAAN